MLPVTFERGRVTRFLLSRGTMECCFGQPPGVTEWIDVHVPGGTPHVLVTIEVRGVLRVGEFADEYGDVGGVYRIRDASVRVHRVRGHPANRSGNSATAAANPPREDIR